MITTIIAIVSAPAAATCLWIHGYFTGRLRKAPQWVATAAEVDTARRWAVHHEQDAAEAIRLLGQLTAEYRRRDDARWLLDRLYLPMSEAEVFLCDRSSA